MFPAQGGWTALMWAAYKGRTDVAQLLLEKGANPNITGQVQRLDTLWGSRHAVHASPPVKQEAQCNLRKSPWEQRSLC